MKPITSSTNDNPTPSQTAPVPQPQTPTALNGLPSEYAAPAGSSDPNFQAGTFPVQQETSVQDAPLEANSMNSFAMPDMAPINPIEQSQSMQPTPNFDIPTANPQSAPVQPAMSNTNTQSQEAPTLNSMGTNPPGQNVQMTNPQDMPPSPPTQPQPVQNTVNLGNAVAEEKPKKKFPVFLIFLLVLVVIVLGAVGFLAFQNYQLTKNTPVANTQTTTLTQPVAVDPFSSYVVFKSTLLPIVFLVSPDWKTEETIDKDLSNTILIKSNSTDFAYSGSEIASGFEFRVGPVNDLSKRYDSFDAFAAEENASNLYTTQTINGITWLIKGNEGKTIINSIPVTVALYSSTSEVAEAVGIFNKIINSFVISAPTPTTPVASPSATPT